MTWNRGYGGDPGAAADPGGSGAGGALAQTVIACRNCGSPVVYGEHHVACAAGCGWVRVWLPELTRGELFRRMGQSWTKLSNAKAVSGWGDFEAWRRDHDR